MKKQVSLIGVTLIYLVFGINLFYLTVEATSFNYLMLAVFLVIDVLCLGSLIFIYRQITKFASDKIDSKDHLFDFLSILFGALIIYFLANNFEFNSLVSIGVLALVSGVVIKKHAPEITIGGFIGAGMFLDSGYLGVIIATIISSVLYFTIRDVFNGFGGKLGTTAFMGGIITYLVFIEEFGKGVSYNGINVLYVMLIALASAVLAFILNNEFKLGPIVPYGVVILLGSIFLLFTYTKEYNFLSVVFGASLIGMTSKEQSEGYFVVVLASLIYGTFIVVSQSFTNIGGRAGLFVLMSILTAKVIKHIINNFLKGKKKELSVST